MDIKGLFKTIGLGAATVGAGAANAATGGMLSPLTDTLLKALGAKLDPEAKLKLEQAAAAASAELQKAEYDHAEKIAAIATTDVQNARAREIALKDRLPSLLALVVTGGFFGLLTIMVFRPIPNANSAVLNVMLGALGTAWISIIAYYYGSSSGSAAKTDLMGKFRQHLGQVEQKGETPK